MTISGWCGCCDVLPVLRSTVCLYNVQLSLACAVAIQLRVNGVSVVVARILYSFQYYIYVKINTDEVCVMLSFDEWKNSVIQE